MIKKSAIYLLLFMLFATIAQAQTTIYVNSATGSDTNSGTSASPFKTFHKAYQTAVSGNIIDLAGTFSWTDTDETGDAQFTGYTIAKNLTINGQGADATFIQAATSAWSADRKVLTIAAGSTVYLNKLTIRYGSNSPNSYNGRDGGGINNQGTLYINKCRITQNNAGSASWGGFGGGVVNLNYAKIENSTIDNNHADSQGGGLCNYYTASSNNRMDVINCTIAYNTTLDQVATVGGAGIYIRSGTVSVTNSTIAYNNAMNGGTGGTSGIDIQGTLIMKNSILARNKSQNGYVNSQAANVFDLSNSGTFTDNGGNIIGKYNTSWSGVALNATSWYDVIGNGAGDNVYSLQSSASTTGPLNLSTTLALNSGNNGTETLELTSGSIAVDAGASGANGTIALPTTDQRGFSRTATPDAGAFEFGGINPVPTITVTGNTTAFTSCAGTASANQSFTVSGSFLTNDITLTAPTGFEISTSAASGFNSTLTLTQTAGTVSSTTIYVRLSAAASANPSGNITLTSSGATSQNVAVSGVVNNAATISTSGTPAALNSTLGSPSAASSFTFSANSLSSPVTITVPSPFEISVSPTEGFASSLSLGGMGASTSSGTVEWGYVVPNAVSAGVSKLFIDMRQFNNTGVSPNQVTFIELLDLFSGPATFLTSDAYWAQYSINTSLSNIASSAYPALIRAMGYGDYALKVDFQLASLSSFSAFPIYARLASSATLGNHAGNINLSATCANTSLVTVNGTVVLPPSISVSGSLNTFTACAGTPSTAQSLSVSGANLTSGSVLLTAPAGFEISANASSGYANSLSLNTKTANTTPGQVEWLVAYDPINNTTRIGIDLREFQGTNVAPADVKYLDLLDVYSGPVTFTGADQYWAEYTINSTLSNTASSAYQANIRVGNGFKAFTVEFTFANAATLSATPVYIRTTAAATGSLSGNLSLQSNGANTVNQALTGSINTAATPTITAGGPTTFCQGGTVTLTSSSGTSYLWSNGATTQSITVNTSGNYSVSVSNANGCSAASAATAVTVNALPTTPTITAGGPTTFCQGGTVTLTSSSGTSYLWSNGATTQSITVNSTGNYSVVVSDANGCSEVSAATAVTVNALPATPTITAGGPTTFCQGGTVTLTSSSGTSYLWSNGATTQSITVNTSGNYSVSVSNANGCSAASAVTAVTVNAIPTVNQPLNQTVQNGTAVGTTVFSGAVAGTTYTWTNNNTSFGLAANGTGDIAAFTANYNGSVNATQQTATITVTPSSNGCTGQAKTFTITVMLNAAPTNITLNKADIFEANQVGDLIGNLATSDPDINDTHTYSLVSGLGGADNVYFNISGTTLRANAIFNYLNKSSYSVRIRSTDSGGLQVDKTFTISISPKPQVTGTGNLPGSQTQTAPSTNPEISKGYSSQLLVSGQNLASYSWSPATGLSATNIANPIAKPSQSTTYTVTVTNTFGSTTTISIPIIVNEDYNVVSNNILTPNGDGENDSWSIENIQSYPTAEVKLFDQAGKLVFSKVGYQNNWTGADLPMGTYYFTISFGQGYGLKKGFLSIIR